MEISQCQYCFEKYEMCTCCKDCGFLKGTCECHLEGEYPCTKMHPSDMYRTFLSNPEFCEAFGYCNLEEIDKVVMKMYIKDVWPERLKNNVN